jgi:hypothetical protein
VIAFAILFRKLSLRAAIFLAIVPLPGRLDIEI